MVVNIFAYMMSTRMWRSDRETGCVDALLCSCRTLEYTKIVHRGA